MKKTVLHHVITAGTCFATGLCSVAAQTVGTINTMTNSATITYNGTAPQRLPSATAFTSPSQDVYNLIINNPTNVSYGSSSYLDVFGTLSLTNGTFITGGSLYMIGSISAGSGRIQAGGNKVGFFGTSGAQTIPGNTFVGDTVKNLHINNSSGVSTNGPLSVPTLLTLQTGILTLGSGLDIGGTISYTAGGITAGSNTVTFSGSTAQTIPSGTFTANTVGNLAVTNPAGITYNNSITNTSSFSVMNLGSAVPLFAPSHTITIGGLLRINSFASAPVVGRTFTIDSAGMLYFTRGKLVSFFCQKIEILKRANFLSYLHGHC